ncbi:hypothetical protein Tco_0318282 [Tanacetum coccineum]
MLHHLYQKDIDFSRTLNLMRLNERHNVNQIVGNPHGNVTAPMIGNNGTGQNEETGIPLTTEHHDYLSYEPDEEVEEEELNYNYLFMTKLQPTSFNMDMASVYNTGGISEVPNFDHYYDNEIYNMFTHEEQHLKLHEST